MLILSQETPGLYPERARTDVARMLPAGLVATPNSQGNGAFNTVGQTSAVVFHPTGLAAMQLVGYCSTGNVSATATVNVSLDGVHFTPLTSYQLTLASSPNGSSFVTNAAAWEGVPYPYFSVTITALSGTNAACDVFILGNSTQQ